MSEHRGELLERDTKTHRARVVQVPASVLAEVRGHRISNWRHDVWQPAADELGLPSWATPYMLLHTAASLMAQRGGPVSAASAALGHDPAIFLRTYAHLYPGDVAAVADAMNLARAETWGGDTNRSRPIEPLVARGKPGEESGGRGEA